MRKSAIADAASHNRNLFSRETAEEIDQAVTAWFDEFQRPLKFRETRDPYAIMVSEFMLQQTTVATVEPYYDRFLARFPDVKTLAGATEDDVVAMWAGLGYYRRARQLHAAAKIIAALPDGFSRDVDALRKLPGFGRYTAGAVASQAFDLPAPILEANTVRVYARLAGANGVVGDSAFTKTLWGVADELIRYAASPRSLNMALMELGALICKPQPLCDECPVQNYCAANKAGASASIPQKRPRRESVAVTALCLAIRDNNSAYMVRRIPAGQWHQGMWEFPARRENVAITDASARDFATDALKLKLCDIVPARELRYQVTHHKVTCHVFHCQYDGNSYAYSEDETVGRFLSLEEISRLPMGSAQKKLFQFLSDFNHPGKSL